MDSGGITITRNYNGVINPGYSCASGPNTNAEINSDRTTGIYAFSPNEQAFGPLGPFPLVAKQKWLVGQPWGGPPGG